MPIRLDAHRPEFHRGAPPQLPVRAATTASITISTALNNGDSLDGLTLATGDRVLVKDQSTGSQNGVYIVGASPARAFDMAEGVAAWGAVIYVIAGTANGGKIYRNTNATLPTIDTTALTFTEFTSGGGGITVQDEGSPLSTTATTLDFVGAGVVASGTGATKTITISGGGGGASWSYLGYNTVGGSTQAMTAQRVYCKQITAGGSGQALLGIQAYLDQTVEAVMSLGLFLHADSGSDTIGDLLLAEITPNIVLAHGTGGGISYPARWFGGAIGYELAASTKYWIGIVYHSGTGAPRLYYDGSGSDRYYAGGVTPYYNDGAYNTGAQTNTTNKHSIRALVL